VAECFELQLKTKTNHLDYNIIKSYYYFRKNAK